MNQAAFPKLLSSQIAFDIAKAILDGFDKHYRLFRQTSQQAKRYFETAQWQAAQQAAIERIDYYDRRVQECVQILEDDYAAEELTDAVWRETKLHYIGLLSGHKQPELAETFFNSVCCNILHRSYYHNDFIFVRPVVSTEYIETEELLPTFRVYYPHQDGLKLTLQRIVTNFQLTRPFADLERDIELVRQRLSLIFGPEPWSRTTISRYCRTCFTATRARILSARPSTATASFPLFCRCCTMPPASCFSIPCCTNRSTSMSCSRLRAPIFKSIWKCRRLTYSSCAA